MICMPGVTFVHFSATSVTKLISMPGEISTNSEACPAIGRKPCDTVAKNDATCGCSLSRKMYERKSAMMFILSCLVFCASRTDSLAGGFLQDLDAAAGADARRAGLHHPSQVNQGSDAARCFHPEPLFPHDTAHQRHVFDGRPPG